MRVISGRWFIRVFLAPVALASLSTSPLLADTVTFKSGRVMEDVQAEVKGDSVKITKSDGSSMVVPKSMILKIEQVPTPAEELIERRKGLPDKDVPARLALAAWCEDKKMPQEATRLYEEVLVLDESCEAAHKGLDHLEYQGRWYVTPVALVEAELPRGQGNLAALRSLLSFLDEKGVEAPEMLLRSIIEVSPDDGEVRERLGHIKIGSQWFEDVDAALAELLSNQEAGTAESFLQLGDICKKAKPEENLKSVAEAGLLRHPDSLERWKTILEGTQWQIDESGKVSKRVLVQPGTYKGDGITLVVEKKGNGYVVSKGEAAAAIDNPGFTENTKAYFPNPAEISEEGKFVLDNGAGYRLEGQFTGPGKATGTAVFPGSRGGTEGSHRGATIHWTAVRD